MSSSAPAKDGFTIKRSNLQKIKELKAKLKKLEGETYSEPQAKPTQDNKQQDTQKKQDPNRPKQNPYEKRKPLNEQERKFVSDLWYRGEGNYSGRDTFFQKLKRIYDSKGTPQSERISRRRLWEWLRKQEINQIHRAITKHSIQIKPTLAKSRFERCQIDLIIKGKDSVQTHKAILTCIDVGTRMSFTRVLKGTAQKDSIQAMESILDEALNLLNEEDRKARAQRPQMNKSKTWAVVASDNGAEFGAEFTSFLESKHIRHVKGVANKSTSQAMIERFNRTLQSSMQREISATGAKWYDTGFVKKHTDMLNNQTNRNLKLKKEGDKTFTIYTPKELFEEDRAVLDQLFKNKMSALGKSNKSYKHETDIEIGQTVRIVLKEKRKQALVKGFTPNWSRELYTVYKIKRPKDAGVKPYLYFVKSKSNGTVLKEPFTIQDVQIVHGEVEPPPKDIQIKQKVGGTKTRNQEKQEEQPQTPPSTPKRKPVAEKPKNEPPKQKKKSAPTAKSYVDRQVQSFIDYEDKEYRIEGTVVEQQRRKKGAGKVWFYKVKWDSRHSEKYDYKEFEWVKKSDLEKILTDVEKS
jgi:transposase InsO family protein